MKSRWLSGASVLVTLLTLASAAAAQTVDELIAKNLEAKGGAEKLHAVQTVKQSSSLSMQGTEGLITVYGKRPNLLRQEVTVGGRTVINGFDGVTPWIVNPLVRGGDRPIAVTGPQAQLIREQSNFDGSPLLNYKALGYRVELMGEETINERKVYHLRLLDKTSHVQHCYLDAETALETKLVSDNETGSLSQEFSDYRVVEGIKVPFMIRTFFNGVPQSTITVTKVEFNVALDDGMFKMPK